MPYLYLRTTLLKLHLADYDIEFCKNCLACMDSGTEEPVVKCSTRDDMDHIRKGDLSSDFLIFGTPVYMGYASAIMMIFLERIC